MGVTSDEQGMGDRLRREQGEIKKSNLDRDLIAKLLSD